MTAKMTEDDVTSQMMDEKRDEGNPAKERAMTPTRILVYYCLKTISLRCARLNRLSPASSSQFLTSRMRFKYILAPHSNLKAFKTNTFK